MTRERVVRGETAESKEVYLHGSVDSDEMQPPPRRAGKRESAGSADFVPWSGSHHCVPVAPLLRFDANDANEMLLLDMLSKDISMHAATSPTALVKQEAEGDEVGLACGGGHAFRTPWKQPWGKYAMRGVFDSPEVTALLYDQTAFTMQGTAAMLKFPAEQVDSRWRKPKTCADANAACCRRRTPSPEATRATRWSLTPLTASHTLQTPWAASFFVADSLDDLHDDEKAAAAEKVAAFVEYSDKIGAELRPFMLKLMLPSFF